MADTKLSALTELAVEPAATDEFYINDGGVSKKIAWSTIKAVFATNPLTGLPVTYKFPFTYATANLATGVTVYTPAVGDILLDAWIEVTTAFDGTTPSADIGTFVNQNAGLWDWSVGVVTLQATSTVDGYGDGLTLPISGIESLGRPGGSPLPAKFNATNPLKLVVNQTGAVGGTALDSTVGAGILYFTIVKPVSA